MSASLGDQASQCDRHHTTVVVPDMQHIVGSSPNVDVLWKKRQEGCLLLAPHGVRPIELDLRPAGVVAFLWTISHRHPAEAVAWVFPSGVHSKSMNFFFDFIIHDN